MREVVEAEIKDKSSAKDDDGRKNEGGCRLSWGCGSRKQHI